MPIYVLLERQHYQVGDEWVPEDKLATCFEAKNDDDAERKKRSYMKNIVGNVILFRLEAQKLLESE